MSGEHTDLPARRRLAPEVRHRVMASIRKKDTRPELALRAALREAGLVGYRVHASDLPGTPDVAFRRWKVAIFVDGVFWHGRPDYFQFGTKGPYWDQKIARNMARDATVATDLTALGWLALRFWDVDVLAAPGVISGKIGRALARRGRRAA